MKPKSFIMNSDYATTQNDGGGSLTYTLTAGTTIADGTAAVFEASVLVGTRNAYMRCQASVSTNPGKWFSGTTIFAQIDVSTPSFGTFPWPLYHSIERTSPTSVRGYVEIFNNTGEVMTIQQTQTITWDLNTFLSPFPS